MGTHVCQFGAGRASAQMVLGAVVITVLFSRGSAVSVFRLSPDRDGFRRAVRPRWWCLRRGVGAAPPGWVGPHLGLSARGSIMNAPGDGLSLRDNAECAAANRASACNRRARRRIGLHRLDVGEETVEFSDHGNGEAVLLIHAGDFVAWFPTVSEDPALQAFRRTGPVRAGDDSTAPAPPGLVRSLVLVEPAAAPSLLSPAAAADFGHFLRSVAANGRCGRPGHRIRHLHAQGLCGGLPHRARRRLRFCTGEGRPEASISFARPSNGLSVVERGPRSSTVRTDTAEYFPLR